MVENHSNYALFGTIIESARSARSGNIEAASKKLLDYGKKNPEEKIHAILSSAQIMLAQVKIWKTRSNRDYYVVF